MATKSILKNVDMRDRKLTNSFVQALESAKGKSSKEVVFSRSVKEAKQSDITKIFGAK